MDARSLFGILWLNVEYKIYAAAINASFWKRMKTRGEETSTHINFIRPLTMKAAAFDVVTDVKSEEPEL